MSQKTEPEGFYYAEGRDIFKRACTIYIGETALIKPGFKVCSVAYCVDDVGVVVAMLNLGQRVADTVAEKKGLPHAGVMEKAHG